MRSLFAVATLFLAGAFAAPASSSLEARQFYPDAPYTITLAQAESAITCPRGIKGAAGGVVFLVHGTGSTGSETWEKGPYNLYLPTANKGYDVCWIDLPGRALGDAQISAEYVSLGIKSLAAKSKTGKVTVIGHSQGGGLNPQWALVFWPSTQRLVSKYFALAGDFKGTGEGLLLCNPLKTPSCLPSIWQQTLGSNYLAAQNSLAPGGGGRALVPTYSIYTVLDDIIQPEFPPIGPTSYLQGAQITSLQNPLVCGGLQIVDHFLIPFAPVPYAMVKAALASGQLLTFDRLYCTGFKEDVILTPEGGAAALRSAVSDAVAVAATFPKTFSEPPLKPYVCQRGYATNCA